MTFDISGKEFLFQAGQYVEVTLPQLLYDDGHGKSRNFSIASSPNEKKILRIAFRASKSGFKRTLTEMALGSIVEVRGPFGDMLLPTDHSSPIIFVAGGTGITPFRSMIQFATEEKAPYNITLLYANKDKQHAAFLTELEDLAKQNPSFILHNHFGLIDALALRKNIDESMMKNAFWYVVGPPTMTVATIKILHDLGVEKSHVRFEKFNNHSVPEEAQKEARPIQELQMFQEAVENTTQHIIITDSEGVILYANPAVEKTTGYPAAEVIGNKPSLWGKQMPQEFYSDLWRTIKQEKKSFAGEIQNKRKNGDIYTVFANISPIIDSAGNINFFIGMETDISKQKEFEKLLVHEKESLEKINKLMIGRELKMVELKKEIAHLKDLPENINI